MSISLDVLSTREGVLMYPNQAAEEIENGGTFIAEVTYETLSTRAGVLRFPQEAANRILEIAASSSSSSPLLNDLIAYYRFAGNGEDTVNGRDLTVESGTFVDGKINGALDSGYAYVDNVNITTTGEITISMWINLGTDADDVISAGEVQITDGESYIKLEQKCRQGADTRTRIAAYDGASLQEDTTIRSVVVNSDSQWLHVLGVFLSNGTARIWFNGTDYEANYNLVPFEIVSILVTSTPDSTSKIGDIGIWNRALSESEILQLYNSENGYDPTV